MKIRQIALLAFTTLTVVSVNESQAQTAQADTVIVAERYFDSKSGKMIANPTVLIRNQRIVSVQSGGAIPTGAAKVIRLDGMTLLPGLIDMHTHIDSDPIYGGYNSLQFT
ncbi:MAG: hypothetical protein KA350_07950, partial [Arenimonas sp.]|nr:hypothetical protein [Arenimonas sp.]